MNMRKSLFLFIFPTVLLAMALATGLTLVWRLFVITFLVLAAGYLWTALSVRGLNIRIGQLTRRCQAGDGFVEEIAVSSVTTLPRLLLEARENTDLPGYQNSSVFSLSAAGVHRWQSQVRCRRRGEYTIGSFTVAASDPFGLFERSVILGNPQRLLVCPATVDLPHFELMHRQDSGYGPGRWLAAQMGPNVATVREYITGDSLKNVHWGSTAHTGKLMVKVLDLDRSRNVARSVWVVLDLFGLSHSSDGDWSSEELCIEAAASLVRKYVDAGRHVGFIAAGDRPYFFEPDTGTNHLWQVLSAMATMKASGDIPIDQLISREIGRFGPSTVLVTVTPASNDAMAASLRHAKSRGGLVVTVLVAATGSGASVTNAARSLISSSVQAHVVRPGEDLSVALDSRAFPAHARHADTEESARHQPQVPLPRREREGDGE